MNRVFIATASSRDCLARSRVLLARTTAAANDPLARYYGIVV
jgi:hypothetical protein